MLSELVVEGLGVIDRAELHLTEGSSALTGETGAGKTLLVAALGLLVGARSDRSLVRHGVSSARVDARFSLAPNHPVRAAIVDMDLGDQDADELVLSRTIEADGKSKARISGRPVTMTVLHDIGSRLVEIAGQSEHHQLVGGRAQRDVLDSFAGEEAVAAAQATAQAVEEHQLLAGRLEELQSSERNRARELDVLRSEIAEIEAVAPRPSEGEDLAVEVKRLEHADAIASGVAAALEALKGDRGVGELVPEARRDLDAIADKDPRIAPLVARLDAVAVEVTDIVDELARLAVPADPSALAAIRERVAILSRLRRKYGVSEEDVLAYRERSIARVAELEEAGSDEATLGDEVARARKTAGSTAERLSNLRRVAAAELGRTMQSSMAVLALPDARFEVVLEPRDLYRGGRENVGFKVAATPGEPARPLAKVASGGELSRISLALRLLTSAGASTAGTGTTMVFDEVDAGVGGEAARAVGECLAQLGQRPGAQVLVVTHLPQVAAFADHQYVVAKHSTESHTTSVVTKVEGEARVNELSRMLAGLPESERAREHAQELLELAVRQGHG